MFQFLPPYYSRPLWQYQQHLCFYFFFIFSNAQHITIYQGPGQESLRKTGLTLMILLNRKTFFVNCNFASGANTPAIWFCSERLAFQFSLLISNKVVFQLTHLYLSNFFLLGQGPIITCLLFRYWSYLIETQMMLKIPTNQKVFFHVVMRKLMRMQMLVQKSFISFAHLMPGSKASLTIFCFIKANCRFIGHQIKSLLQSSPQTKSSKSSKEAAGHFQVVQQHN